VVLLGLSPSGQDVYRTVHASARLRISRPVAALSSSDQDALARVLSDLEQTLRAAEAEPAGAPRIRSVQHAQDELVG
jgi:hypothetical protein